jgi:lipid-A-disaccharide synthase
MEREVVKELIQSDFNKNNLKKELNKILDFENRKAIYEAYYELEKKLGSAGASEKTANLIYNTIKQ